MDRSALRGGGCALLYGVRGNRLGNLADRRSHLCTTGMIAEERVTTRAVAFRTHTVTGQDIGSHGGEDENGVERRCQALEVGAESAHLSLPDTRGYAKKHCQSIANPGTPSASDMIDR